MSYISHENKNTAFLHHLLLMPIHSVSNVNWGQGSQSVCPLTGTHLGCQTVQGFVYLFFHFTYSLSSVYTYWLRTRRFCLSQARLTLARVTKRVHTDFGVGVRPWNWHNTCRNDMCVTTARTWICYVERNMSRCLKKNK